MRLNRFFTDADISGKTISLFQKDLVHQIGRVLRLTKEHEIILCKDGYDARVRITKLLKNGVEGEIVSLEKNIVEPQRRVVLYCSILKKENFEMVVQKAIEAGVSEVVPLKTKRTVKTGISEDRLKKIAKEAAEQCGRARIPAIRESINFSKALSVILSEAKDPEAVSKKHRDPLSVAPRMTLNLFFDTRGKDMKDFFRSGQIKDTSMVNVFVGPEGGWNEEELRMAREKGCIILSLGARTLRAETAAIVGTFLAVSL